MKKLSLILTLAALTTAAAHAGETVKSSPRAAISCTLGDYGKVTFHVDLAAKKVSVSDDPQGPSLQGNWSVKASFQKNGVKIANASEFKTGKDSGGISTLLLAGDNADDTDFLLTLSYQDCPTVTVTNLKSQVCSAMAIVGSFVVFGDSQADEATTYPATACKLALE